MRLSSDFLGFSILLLGVAEAFAAAGVGRFSVQKKSAEVGKREMTPSEIYARALTRRKPTPRSTAQRRQVSDAPPVDNSVPLGVFTGDLQLGNLNVDPNTGAIGLTDGSPSQWTYTASPSWLVGTQKRITSNSPTHPVLGLAACDGGDGNLGAVSTEYVCLTGVASPGTPPGSTPVDGISTSIGSTIDVETDIWSFNYLLGTITPVWINPGGLNLPLTLMVNQLSGKVVATPNPVLFPLVHGTSWVAFTLQYLIV